MAKLTIKGVGEFTVPDNKRLVKALVEDANTDQLHACGGQSRCTSCRVKFLAGEPQEMTEAEQETLRVREITETGVRLSCQIQCKADMEVEIISGLAGSGRQDQGSPVADEIQPTPQWITQS